MFNYITIIQLITSTANKVYNTEQWHGLCLFTFADPTFAKTILNDVWPSCHVAI